MKKVQYLSRGFTLIELVVVFSIIAILSVVGIASFVSYSQEQSMNNAVLDLTTLLNTAKSQSISQVKPSGCTSALSSYSVELCSVPSYIPGNCTQSDTNNHVDYKIVLHCGNDISEESGRLPNNIKFGTSMTLYSIYFPILTGQVGGNSLNEQIVLCESGQKQAREIIIDSVGNISTSSVQSTSVCP